MKNVKDALLALPWLWSLVLAQDNVQRHGHDLRDLSDALNSALGPGYESFANQVESQLAASTPLAGTPPPAEVTATSIDGGPNGVNSNWFKDVTKTSAAPVGEGVANSTAPPPAAVEPTSTLRSTVTTTITVVPTPVGGAGNGTSAPALLPSSTQSTGGASPANGTLPSPAPIMSHSQSFPLPANTTTPTTTTGLPTPASSGALATGKGTVLPNGACDCLCACASNAFPSPNAGGLQTAPIIVINGTATTSLQTVISSPTTSVSLPTTLVIDTSSPPVPGATSNTESSPAATPAPNTSTTESSSVISTSSSLPASTTSDTVPPTTPTPEPAPPAPPAAPTTPDSTFRFTLNPTATGTIDVVPTPAPALGTPLGGTPPVIDISSLTLVSSVNLGNLGR